MKPEVYILYTYLTLVLKKTLTVHASEYYLQFDDDGCSSCISVMNVSYPSLEGRLSVTLENGTEVDMGSVTNTTQLVALADNDFGNSSMSRIKVSLTREGELIEKTLIGPPSTDTETFYILTGEEVTIDITIQTSIEVVFGVDYGDQIIVMENCGGTISSFKLVHTYSTPGNFLMNVLASAMTEQQSSSLSIEVIYDLNGLTATSDASENVEPGHLLTIQVNVSDNAQVPMGSKNVTISCPDGENVLPFVNTSMIETCNMSMPGSHTVAVTVKGLLSSMQLLNRTYEVWDDLKFKIEPDAVAFLVGNNPSFTITNKPKYNFDYIIDFDEGTVLQMNGTTHLMTPFKEIALPPLTYKKAGIYSVSVFASNPGYSIVQNITLRFEYPIPPSVVEHDVDGVLLCPPSVAQFSIYSENRTEEPEPEGVFCRIYYGEGSYKTVPVNLTYGSDGLAHQRTHAYSTEGIKNVEFYCFNLVSNITMKTTIKTFFMKVQVIGIEHHAFVLMNYTEPTDLVIQYSVQDFATPPPNLTHSITWESGQEAVEMDMTALQDNNTYTARGFFLISIYFRYYSEERTDGKYVRVGVLDIYTPTRLGMTNSTQISFDVTLYLLSIAHTVTIDWGDGSSNTAETFGIVPEDQQPPPKIPQGETKAIHHIFIKAGIFTPTVTYTSDRGTEMYRMNDTVTIQTEIKDLKVETEQTYTFAEDVAPKITLGDMSLPVANVTCVFNYTDDAVTVVGDLMLQTDAISTAFRYKELGPKELLVTCSNMVSEQVLNASYLVFSICFDSSDLFDQSYRTAENPLKIYSSLPQVVTARVSLTDVCKNRTNINYTWKINKVIPTGYVEIPIEQPNSISIKILTYLSEPAIYRLEMSISFPEYPDDYVNDYMFINVVDPPLVGVIVGGSKRSVSIRTPVDLDAKTKSYDPKIGIASDDPLLQFLWKCHIVTDNSSIHSFTKPYSSDTSYKFLPSCNINLPATGKINGIDTSSLTPNMWYLIEVTVSKDVRFVTALQVLYITSEDVPLVGIKCKLNCLQKLLAEDITYFESTLSCPTCSQAEIDNAEYLWSIYKFDNSANTYVRQNWANKASLINTDRWYKEFRCAPYVFEEGASYMIEVEVIIPRKQMGRSTLQFNTNTKPYNGKCEVLQDKGWAAVTKYQVICTDWMDEGIRKRKNATLDRREPLTYKIEHKRKQGTYLVYEGAEKSSLPSLLQVCDEADGFVCELVIYVMDSFSSSQIITKQIEVRSAVTYYQSMDMALNNETTEEESLSNLFERMRKDINVTNGFESVYVTSRVASSYASVLNSIPLAPSPLDGIEVSKINDSLSASQDILDGLRKSDPKRTEIKELLEVMIVAIAESVNSFKKRENISLKDIVFFSSALTASVEEPTLVSGKAQLALTETGVLLSNELTNFLDKIIILKEMLEAMAVLSDLEDKIIDVGSPDISGSRPVIDDLSTITYPPLGFHTYEQEYFKQLINQRKKAEADEYVKNAQKTIDACQTMWDNAFKIMRKATAENTTYEKSNRNFESELVKGTIRQLVSKQREKSSFLIGATNTSDEAVTFDFEDIVDKTKDKSSSDLKVVLLKKNIYIQGSNSPIYTSSVVQASARTTEIPTLPITGARSGYNHKYTGFIEVKSPKFIDEDASLMFYWRFVYRHKFEYVCVSLRPTVSNLKYEFFWRSKIPPSDFEYDAVHLKETIDDWVEQMDACLTPGQLKRLGAGFLGVRPYIIDALSRSKRSINQTGFGGNANSSDPLEAPYWIRLISFSCASWNGVQQDWDPSRCEVEIDLRNNRTACLCQSVTYQEITASSFFVPPNAIDFSTVFSKFDIQSQAAVLATILIITVIAIIIGLWGHWKDSQDKLQWGVTLLADNYKDDNYFYLVTVYTGLVRSGGTRSNISFNLSGERDDSGVRRLSDDVRKEFETGSVMHFLMAVPASLGTLQCIRVWHDNAGKGRHASWYLSRIEIHDIQTNDRFDFMCSEWLCIEDGHLERLLPVSGIVNFNNFKTMFYEHARSHVTDDHLWLSVLLRPVKSHFYRIQRVGCCYALLMLTMIANALFFQSKEQKDRQQISQIALGPVRFSLNQMYISFVSVLITAIPTFIMILLFRKSKLSNAWDRKKKVAPDWVPQFIKDHIEFSNKLDDALVVRDIVDDKEGILPHFCVYIGWVLILISSFLSAFFLMLYSMEWGKTLSEEWLTSFFLSFIQSIVVVDPFKVIFMALLFAIFLKAIKNNEPTHYDLKEVTLLANQRAMPNAGRRKLRFSMPFTNAEYERIKLHRERNARMKSALKELLFNAFFLWLLFSISYSNRDHQSFLLHQYVVNNFMQPPKPYRTYGAIDTSAHFFDWLNSTVLPTLFMEEDYRGFRMVSTQRMFSYDVNNFRVGPPRLRQVRTKTETCNRPYVGDSPCIPGYELYSEDTDNYCMGWNIPPCEDYEQLSLTFEAYRYTAASDIWGYPIAGPHNVYGGGGYIANLDVNRLISFESLKELFNSRWIDRNTRAVFFEFTLYNVNKNIFVYISLLMEFPETGGTIPFVNIYPFRPSQHQGAQAGYVLFCELAFCVYLIVIIVMNVVKLIKQRCKFFKQFWQVIDLVMIGVAIAAIAVYVVRHRFTSEALQKYRDNNREFVNFYHVAIWDGTFVGILGFLVAIATVRLIKALGYTSRTAKIYNVLKNSSKVLPGLIFYISTVLASFSFAGLVLFGSLSEGYKSFIACLETLFTAVLGSPIFKQTGTEVQDTWVTILFFVMFVIMVTLTLTNMFLAILLDVMGMTENEDDTDADKDMEMFSYIWESFLGVFTGRKAGHNMVSNQSEAMQAARIAQENNRKPQQDGDGADEIPYILPSEDTKSVIRTPEQSTNIRNRVIYQ